MTFSTKFACTSLLLAATFGVAQSGRHYWDEGHRSYQPWHDTFCKLQLIEVYQPEGGSQPIHLKVKNVSHDRLQYDLSMTVNGRSAGSFHVDNANPGEISDRDASMRFPGTLTSSRIAIRVNSCSSHS
jgi:hypothetical protein